MKLQHFEVRKMNNEQENKYNDKIERKNSSLRKKSAICMSMDFFFFC